MELVIYLLLGIVVGLAVGFLIGYLVLNRGKQNLATRYEVLLSQKQNVESKALDDAQRNDAEKAKMEQNFHAMLDEKMAEHAKAIADIEKRHNEDIQKLITTQNTILKAKDDEHKAASEAQEQRHNEAVKNLEKTLNQTIDNLKANVQATTEKMLKERQEDMSKSNKASMETIVNPLNETIKKMREAMEGYTEKQNEFSGSMKTQIETIIKQTETASKSAEELTTALKRDTKVQGDYGETILDELLSMQGLKKGIHYDLQYVIKDENGKELKGEDGKGLRPDVLFHIDTKRDVVIDSKMNLTDFIAYANAKTPEDRKMYLEKHIKSIENQVKVLSQKDYSKYIKNSSSRIDYVIMFVPISAALWEALRYKPTLWREAMEKNVYIADEQTLFAALRIIRMTWTQIAQVNSQKEVFKRADEMIKRVGMFLKSYQEIGDALKNATKAYDEGEKKLAPEKQSIVTTARQLIALGAKDDKKYTVNRFVDVDDVEQLPEATTNAEPADPTEQETLNLENKNN